MAYDIEHPTQVATCSRMGTPTRVDGREIPAKLTTVDSPTVGVEDITSQVQRTRDGRSVRLALRLWLADVTTVRRVGDVWTVTHRGQTEQLEAQSIVGPFGSGDDDHLEIEVRSRVHGDSGARSTR